jgi:hypothetical protein
MTEPKKHGCLYGFLVFLLFFTAISLFVEFAAPIRIQTLIAEQMRQGLKLQETPEVKISMHPLLYKLVVGQIDSVYVKATNIDAKEGFTVDMAEVNIKGIKFDTMALLRTRQPTVSGIDEGQIRIVLSEKAVNDLIGGQLPGATVKLEKGRIKYSGDLPYDLPGFTFALTGTVTVMPDNVLLFKPTLEEIAGLPVPQEIKDYLANALAVEYRVLELPEGVVMTAATVTPGKMTIDASIDSLDEIIQSAAGGA